jgi:hypothetical protein
MTKTFNTKVVAVAAGLISATLASGAQAYDDRVQNRCKDDYLNFCSAHAVGSTGMRRCMEANGKQLSRPCVNALVDAGEIPRKFKR